MLNAIDKITPHLDYKHAEGNSPAHIKTSLMGSSLNILIKNGELLLGQWQSIYFCEFDGPRNRQLFVEFVTK
jgi:secondary thiamine-phosphate synthase enzyme